MLLTGKGPSPLGSRDRNYFSKPRAQARGFFFMSLFFPANRLSSPYVSARISPHTKPNPISNK